MGFWLKIESCLNSLIVLFDTSGIARGEGENELEGKRSVHNHAEPHALLCSAWNMLSVKIMQCVKTLYLMSQGKSY